MGRCGKQLLFCARIPALILLALLTFFSSVGCCENLLLNGTLSEKESDGLPVDWFTEAYINDPGFTVFSGGTDENGTNWVEIKNIGFNDARFAQTVDVEPETLYRFSAEVYADHVEEGHGANLSVEGLYAFSREIFDTGGEWETLEWYGETGSEQRSVTLFARLGGYSGLSKGRACFRKLLLEEVRAVPGEEIAAKWFSDDSPGVGDTDDAEGEQPFSPFYPWLIVMAVLYGGAGFLLIHRKWPEADPALSEKATRSRHGIILFFALLLSFMLRMVISYNVSGYQVDVNCFVSWGRTMAQSGPARFYQSTGFCDYPPLYMAVLGINSLLSSGAGEGITRVIFRLVPNLCDLTACWFLYRLIRRKKSNGFHKGVDGGDHAEPESRADPKQRRLGADGQRAVPPAPSNRFPGDGKEMGSRAPAVYAQRPDQASGPSFRPAGVVLVHLRLDEISFPEEANAPFPSAFRPRFSGGCPSLYRGAVSGLDLEALCRNALFLPLCQH